MDTIRVLRIIQYEGPRDKVERQVAQSLHGGPKDWGNGVRITIATIGEWPEILNRGLMPHAPHVKVLHGLCDVCGHYGEDCTGEEPEP